MAGYVSYKEAIKEQVVNALRAAIHQDFPDQDLVHRLDIELEYPTTEQNFPRIMVELDEKSLHIAGVGFDEIEITDAAESVVVRHYRFEANIKFKIMALTSLDRDKLSGLLVSLIAFPHANPSTKSFHSRMYDSQFIDIQIANDHILPGGDSVEDVPWEDPTRKMYTAIYSIEAMGEFWTRSDTLELATIGDVKIYPYKPGHNPPGGSTDPRDANVPWTS